MKMLRFFPLFLLIGCGQQRGFGGQDLGGDGLQADETTKGTSDDDDTTTSNDTDSPADALDQMDSAVCDDTGATTADIDLQATGGLGQIAVVHDGMIEQCCADWRFDPVISGDRIEVTYVDVGTTCDCMCTWTLEYTLTDIPAGDWTVSAAGSEVEVRVD